VTVRPLRVLLIAPSLEIVGGQAVQAARLLTGLRTEASIEVEFLPINPRLPAPFRLLQQLKYVRTVLTTIWYWLTLISRVSQVSVVHQFAATGLGFLLHSVPALMVARILGKRIILNFRDGRVAKDLDEAQARIAPWIRRFDEVVTPSGYLVQVFARHSIRARPILNLIDVERFRFRERARPRPVFMHNRSLEHPYNVACTIRAFALIQARYPEAELTIAHQGSLRGELERLVQELCARNVSFVGTIAWDETAALLDNADIYLTSPDIDNMPGSLLECFASGLPVVATRAGGIPWIVEDGRTGLLAECGDSRGLAAAAIRLIEEPGLAQRIAVAARAECEKYQWAAVREGWLALYGELGGRRCHSAARARTI
jgi:L-malate glycosyltransferase